jgi:hypothetical protein
MSPFRYDFLLNSNGGLEHFEIPLVGLVTHVGSRYTHGASFFFLFLFFKIKINKGKNL